MWLVAGVLDNEGRAGFSEGFEDGEDATEGGGGIWTGEEETRGEAVFDYHCCAGSSVELLVFEHNK